MNEPIGTQYKIRDKLNGSSSISPIEGRVRENDYYVHPKLQEDLEGIITTVEKIETFGTEMGHRNYILSGPKGTGKTLGVRYLATRLGCPLYDAKNVCNPEHVARLFEELRKIAKGGERKVLVMVDEIDKYGSRDGIIDPLQQQVLNRWLVEMDGTASNHGIFIFGMTNRPSRVEDALRRPGRFSKEIEFMPPDIQGRSEILKIHADKKGGHMYKVKDPKLLDYAASKTFGYTGADLKGLLNEAFESSALRDDKCLVNKEDMLRALKKTKPSALRDMPFREPKKSLGDIGGYEDHKEIVRRIIENGNGGVILAYGPPGTGKTLMPEAIAGEYGYNLIEIQGNEIERGIVGQTKDELKRTIERAKHLAPCILNLDEVGSLVARKSWTGGTKEGHTGFLQSVLNNPPEGVVIFATENRPDMLLDTFVQRFPHKLYFGMPTLEEQQQIWRSHIPEKVSSEELTGVNDKLSGRDIAHAALLVRDYGLEPSPEVYKGLVEGINHGQTDKEYEAIRTKIGDSVRDFQKVRRFLAGGKKK